MAICEGRCHGHVMQGSCTGNVGDHKKQKNAFILGENAWSLSSVDLGAILGLNIEDNCLSSGMKCNTYYVYLMYLYTVIIPLYI